MEEFEFLSGNADSSSYGTIDAEPNSDKDVNEGLSHAEILELCESVLPHLCSKEFRDTYWTIQGAIPDCYVFDTSTRRRLVLEVVAKFKKNELKNVGGYSFTSHELIEETLRRYTQMRDKPNSALQDSRPWDVGVNLVMKVEVLPGDKLQAKSNYQLKREYNVIRSMWDAFLKLQLGFDEMTGLPIVFDYKEVRNNVFNIKKPSLEVIDDFGLLSKVDAQNGSLAGLSYLTMEKLGPKISYLIEVVRRTPARSLDLATALKLFDQLICRIFQVHRFCVSHNSICPGKLYLGRGVAYNTLYVSGFSMAHKVKSEFQQNVLSSRSSVVSLKELRHTAISHDTQHPVYDLESAFYTLIEMLTGSLPWDSVNMQDKCLNQALISHVKEVKKELWSSESSMVRILSGFSFSVEEGTIVTNVLSSVYSKIKEMMEFKDIERNPEFYCNNLNTSSSSEFKAYMDLRRCALVCFKFAEIFPLIDDSAFKLKSQAFVMKEEDRKLWNLQDWCFTGLAIRL